MADVNNDGDLDLVVATTGDDAVVILLGDGAGGFAATGSYPTGVHPKFATTGDFNGDGDLDFASANQDDTRGEDVSVYLGNGNGSFSLAGHFAACSNPHEVAPGDLNEDGDLDLVVVCWGGSVASLLLGNGDGTFASATAPADAAAAPAPEAPPEGEHETAAIPEATTPAPPAQDGPRRLRRNRKRILSQREVAVYDLGGLAFELFRRDLLTEEVMVRRAQEVAELDDTVRDIDARLGEIDRERRERRNRAPADPDVGCCMVCRSPFRADARFCSQCGAQVVPPAIGDEQPTVVIPAPASE